MLTAIVVISFTLAGYALVWGLWTEFKQSRDDGPIAVVATMPFGVASALLATIGTFSLVGRELSPWIYILQFILLAVLFVLLINSVSAKSANR
jgi:multisubunit Na+/H+ antiporter MnhC subunit